MLELVAAPSVTATLEAAALSGRPIATTAGADRAYDPLGGGRDPSPGKRCDRAHSAHFPVYGSGGCRSWREVAAEPVRNRLP
jgi:hypothetical protein